MSRTGAVIGAAWVLSAAAGAFAFSPSDRRVLHEQTFAMVRITKDDREMLR